ncbi:hypothetical protein AS4_12550 [Acinetobacter guillouiae]|nr:hypothetical protein AS4_12550 [Acinetobacter guillouiae]
MWLAIFIFAENNINQNNVLVKIAALNKTKCWSWVFQCVA